MRFTKSCVVLLALIVSLGLFVSPVLAETIEIQFTGLDMVYDGTNITDATDPAGGIGSISQADPLTSIVFIVRDDLGNTIEQHSLSEDIYADLRIVNVPQLNANGDVVTSGGNGDAFGFDLFGQPGGWRLALNINKFDVYYSGLEIAVAAAGTASSVSNNNLPFDLSIDPSQRISVVVSSTNVTNFQYDAGQNYVVGFDASSTGSINGAVPEPSTIVLLVSLSTLGLMVYGWRRRHLGR